MTVIAILQPRPTYPELHNHPIANAALQPALAVSRIFDALSITRLEHPLDNFLLSVIRSIVYPILAAFFLISLVPATIGWSTLWYVNHR